jgi:nucleoside phosphorylase
MIRIPTIPASLLALAAFLAAPAAFAVCEYPHSPAQFPDGNTAKLEEMVTAQQSVKQYMATMDTYLKCIDEENPPAPAGTTLTDEQKKAQDSRERVRAQKHNAAVADMESVAERFNVQLRIFRAKSAKG